MTPLLPAVLATALCTLATGASAVGLYAGDPSQRAAFEADAGPGLALESFEDAFPPGFVQDFPVPGPTAFTATSTVSQMAANDFARLVSDGTYALSLSEENSPTVTFTFAAPILSLGVDILDLNFGNVSYSDDAGNAFADVLLGDGGGPEGGPGFENRQFFGIVSATPFTSATFAFSTPDPQLSGTIAFDRMSYGGTAPVPLPLPVLALASGLGLLGALGRRRRG